ncbi:Serine/threonine protein kinase [Olavius algarvensis associated proteobacterium Delta 3]|nr:Serine/threonine protein kinase [Olavius algarvensis associated proteobacterium Delta 3]
MLLGRDPYIDRLVAIKLSKTSDEYLESFFLEAQSSGRLNHPNIVAVYDAGVYEEYCYIAMEYLRGDTLEARCHKDRLLPADRAVGIIFTICTALEYAHQRGVIHRDVKPSNIMFNDSEEVKITDFGIAQVTDNTAPLGIFGTPSYMPPEQLKEEIVGPQGDIFSLGCVLYELLSGQKAFSGANNFSIMYKITHEDPPPLLSIRPDLPPILEDITRKAIAKDLKARYQSCGDLAYDLRVALRGLTGTPVDEKLTDIIDYVHHVPFFVNFTKDQVRELIAASNIVKVPSGKVIVEESEIDDSFYIILSGKTQVKKANAPIASLGGGECFGEMSFISGQARSASVVAVTNCALLKISATLLDRSSKSIQLLFYKNFARTLVRRLAKSN